MPEYYTNGLTLTFPSPFVPYRLLGTLGSQKGSIAPGTGPLTLPAVRNDLALGSAASFSGRGLHLGKTWRERCSWKCTSIGLIILCAILTALVAYFAGKCWGASHTGTDVALKYHSFTHIHRPLTYITTLSVSLFRRRHSVTAAGSPGPLGVITTLAVSKQSFSGTLISVIYRSTFAAIRVICYSSCLAVTLLRFNLN